MTAGQVLDDNTESLEEAYYYLLVRQSFLMLTFWWTGYKHVAYLIRTSKICVVHGGVQQKHRAPFSLFIMKNNWQIESRELAVGLVVEDGVRGSDVFACLHVSQLLRPMDPVKAVFL